MTTSITGVHLNPSNPFNPAIADDDRSVLGAPVLNNDNKLALRTQLRQDMEVWLSEGNQITTAPDAINDSGCRRVEVYDSIYFF
jgi:hypothetical protein